MKKVKMYTLVLGLSLLSLPLAAHNEKEEKSSTKEEKAKAETQLVVNTTVSETPFVTSFNGGLVLSRVCLESMTSLSPYADATAGDYEERKLGLAGLVVFHLADKNYTQKDNLAESGVFVWDGEKWQQMSFEFTRKRK